MLTILWLIVWATVGDAFYDVYNWYKSDDGVTDERAFDPQRVVRENFSDILRSFADSYIPKREGDDELTLAKVKSRLRTLKVFTHTGNSKDFEPSKGQVLPLHEGARFCTMGRHTKGDCNHCTCVAGQLYMCTGIICPKPPAKPQSLITCKEGKRRKIDSCNYCYCRHGHEICSTRDCRLDHDHLLIRSQYTCHEGARRKIGCNRCLCRNGEQYCTKKNCTKKKLTKIKLKRDNHYYRNLRYDGSQCDEGSYRKVDSCNYCLCLNGTEMCTIRPCPENLLERISPACKNGSVHHIDPCNYCTCQNGAYVCTNNPCAKRFTSQSERMALRMTYSNDNDDDPSKKCKIGERYRIDSCNYCYCNSDRERVCSDHKCTYPKHVDDKYPLAITEKQCKIGSRFRKDECNYCYCNYDHRLVCSNNQCTRKSRTAPKICLPHERFRMDGCNWCYCNKERQRVCTTKVCDPKHAAKQSTKLRNSLNFECEVGQIHRIDDCNFCRCTFSRKWMCSDNVCQSNYDDHNSYLSKTKLCTEGIRRQVDACNYCVCHRGVEFCTRKSCWGDILPTIFSKPECLVGDPVPDPDPCNQCICLNSDILCTDNRCIQRQLDIKKSTCVEGHKFRMDDGCNFCICQHGQNFCTIRACLANAVSNSADCNEGEVTPAEDRCNMCVCMRGKIICTNKDCSRRKLRDAISEGFLPYIQRLKMKKHKMTQGTKRRCIPGKKYLPEDFDPNCPNDCICDRHEVLCTKRKCYNNSDKKTPLKWPLGRVEMKTRNTKHLLNQVNCVEYEKLPSDDPCNYCICLNGRKVCNIITCTDDNEGDLGSEEAMFINNRQGSKGNKGNMGKKNNTFCEPFTFFSPDNNRFCRNCFCLHNGLALCLLNLCKYSKDISNQNSPEELHEVCNPGEIAYPTKCVTCTCSEQRRWICTREQLSLCQERDCDKKDEFHMGFFPYCAGCKCSVKEWFCSIKPETCRDYSNVTCPLGTFIHNPRQHCSICLCGGYEEGSHNMCFTEAKCVRQVTSHL